MKLQYFRCTPLREKSDFSTFFVLIFFCFYFILFYFSYKQDGKKQIQWYGNPRKACANEIRWSPFLSPSPLRPKKARVGKCKIPRFRYARTKWASKPACKYLFPSSLFVIYLFPFPFLLFIFSPLCCLSFPLFAI